MPDRRLLVVVFVVALVCRAAFWAAALPDPSRLLSPPDSAEYLTIARNVAAGHGFSADTAPPYRPDLRRTPAYTSVLAAVFLLPFGDERLASLIGALAGAATVAATYWIAWRLFGPLAALIGALLLAVDLTSVSYSVLILTETFFTVLLVAGVVVLLHRPLRPPISVWGGVLLGLATLCRPAGVFLGPASLPVCAWRHAGRRLIVRDYLWVNAAFAVVVLTWVARNALVAGTPTLTSIASVNLYFHRAAALEARLQGRSVDDVRLEWERQFESLSGQWSEADKHEWMTQRARDVIASNPGTYLLITLDGFILMMQSDPTELPRVLGLREGSQAFRAAGAAASLQLWMMYPAAILGLAVAARDGDRRRAALVPLTLIAYFVLVSGPEAYSRFRVPVMPFVAILSGFGIEQLAAWTNQRFLSRAKIRSNLASTTSQR